MARLTWISDTDLETVVAHLLAKAEQAKVQSSNQFGRNVIDPFSSIFEMAGFGLDYNEWVSAEKVRQAQKTLQNFIGEFHQNILGSCNGWTNLGVGNIVDLLNPNALLIAEVKNKYNTMSGGQLSTLYWSLESAVMNKTSVYKGYTAYYVEIIPKKPVKYNDPFTPSDKQTGNRCPTNQLIRQIDGASFYEIATGQPNALENLFDILPDVIHDLKGSNNLDKTQLKLLFKAAYGNFV